MNISEFKRLSHWCTERHLTLLAVSKKQTTDNIKALYDLGQRHFGENKVQELLPKYEALPKDIHWHLIGHLQTNKVKYITPFVHLIQSVDSIELLTELNKQAMKNNKVTDYLLQIHIAEETTKFGLNETELYTLITSKTLMGFKNIRLRGLMGMATHTENRTLITEEFRQLKKLFDSIKSQYISDSLDTLSMGMSNDYQIAAQEGSTMIRVGSLLFGDR